ncbi:MAG: hypothetical protein MZV64_04515 [Ignavibacteriales bacterium]|nr:hypothetical protein [Ignavibacteriales bacterium]
MTPVPQRRRIDIIPFPKENDDHGQDGIQSPPQKAAQDAKADGAAPRRVPQGRPQLRAGLARGAPGGRTARAFPGVARRHRRSHAAVLGRQGLLCPSSRAECPAAEFDRGDMCWLVNGTICSGADLGSWESKMAVPAATCPRVPGRSPSPLAERAPLPVAHLRFEFVSTMAL